MASVPAEAGQATMWTPESLGPRSLAEYRGVAPDEQIEKALALARGVKGLRVVHVSSTARGGGVAEILWSLAPLMRDLGLDARWYVMPGNPLFFDATKQMHNLLQGASGEISGEMRRAYVAHAEGVARAFKEQGITADVWIMHDPQSLPLAALLPGSSSAIWVCHVDTTTPNPSVVQLVRPWLRAYSLQVFSSPHYVLPLLPAEGVRVATPAIDPLRRKNLEMDPAVARSILAKLGVDPTRPLIAQVSRFDRWKDPCGVIDAYRLARAEVPDLQLALAGVITAQDDPEALPMFENVRHHARGDPDIHLFIDPQQVDEAEVAALQQGASVVVQKSLREGFGLSVTEALWKGKPTVGGRCGGIQLQIIDGETGFLTSTVEECASRICALLADRGLAQRLGSAGKERVRQRFLLPRLLVDYLRFILEAACNSPSLTSPDAAPACETL